MRRGGRRATRPPAAAVVFWVALGLAAALTAALVWLLTLPAGLAAGAREGEAYPLLLVAARLWTASAWAVVILAGVRLLRRP